MGQAEVSAPASRERRLGSAEVPLSAASTVAAVGGASAEAWLGASRAEALLDLSLGGGWRLALEMRVQVVVVVVVVGGGGGGVFARFLTRDMWPTG